MKRIELIIRNTMTDNDVLRAKRKVAKINGERKDVLNRSERHALALEKEHNALLRRRGERQMIEESIALSESVMTDAEIQQWNEAQELSLDRQVGIFGTPVLV